MAIPTIQTALNGGEFSPELYGRTDLDKYRRAASTMRNFFASYRGGASTRAGTRFVGICKQGNQGQANNVLPPRNIPFQFSTNQGIVIEAGDKYFRFISNAGYITETALTISNVTTGTPAIVTTTAPHGYVSGDEVFVQNVVGQIGLNGRSFLVQVISSTLFSLVNPLDGSAVSTVLYPAYVSGGTAARIYTLPTPYAIADVALLKFAQSADVMSIVHPSYAPADLTRISAANWTLITTRFAADIARPTNVVATPTDAATTGQARSFWYQFVSTATDGVTGQESQASNPGYCVSVDQSVIAGSIFLESDTVPGATSYNFYQGPISLNNPPSSGAIFGFIGSSYGNTFTDTNVLPDFSISPPIHTNPFATTPIISIGITSFGSGYSANLTTAASTSPTGDNAVLQPVVVNGGIAWISVISGGSGYTGSEPVVISGGGTGAGAIITKIGPATGTFPSTVAYFQQRRFYANTLNNPDTYFASQPGAFTNFDTSLPVKDSDAIVGSPWSQQVNGIQWMINMPGGLVILTGLGAWQLSGGATGIATASAVTPSNQVANPQAYNGVSPSVPPIVINYDILYVQNRGSIVRNLSYNYFINIYTGTDMTVLSNHLFEDHTILQWGWAEEPHKLVWCVRDDGILLSLTFLKEQDVYAWARHDTNGLFQSVCTVSEPPVNAPYFVVKRLIQNNGNPVWVYMQERMDDRVFDDLLDVWCVDAGLSYPQNTPNATITISSAVGVPTLLPPTVIYGGSNYGPGTFAEISDETGFGAQIELTVTGGVVTAATLTGTLTGYTNPTVTVIDPSLAGGNAVVQLLVQNLSVVAATAPVFTGAAGFGAVGDVIRTHNDGILEVTRSLSSTQVEVNVRRPVPAVPCDPLQTGMPVAAGDWMIAAPTTVLYGLNHLEGMVVSILADGSLVAPQTVVNGTITLPNPATFVVAGLGFTAQLQTLYLDLPGPVTIQGRRKELDQVIIRVTQSILPFEVGANQPDAASRPSQANTIWQNMTQAEAPYGTEVPLQPFDFVTGDIYVIPFDQLGNDKGQLAIQQTQPLPLTVTAAIPWVRIQDDAEP